VLGKNVEMSIQQVNMPERMKMIIEWTGNCLMDVSEAHKIWLKKLPRVNGRLDPSPQVSEKC